ncbi:MAG: alanine racemase [Actinomycetota bacterium]|nr:alanine racemase [Actinomycetota bacterium]
MARAWAEVSLGAVRRNVEVLRELAAPAEVCAVVKADGYGHGAVPVARAALDAGAAWLGVAQVPEASAIRGAEIDAPMLLLSEPRPDELDDALAASLHITVYRPELIAGLSKAVAAHGIAPVPVHLKVDTGMRRVGVATDDAVAVATRIAEDPYLSLQSVWTHCAVADEPDNPFTALQLERYEAVLADLEAAGIPVPLRHAANSAAAIAHPASRYDLVRCGISIYGIPPAPALASVAPLVPAVRLATEVSFVKVVPAGEGVSYGHRQRTARDTRLATLPIGYADGVFRNLPLAGQEVLIGGRRHPMLGVVTMDQVMVDLGPDSDVAPGDEAVLLGAQGDERITPDEWAAKLGTISYEVVCALGARIERRYVN